MDSETTDDSGTEKPAVAESNAEGQEQGIYEEPEAEADAEETEEGTTTDDEQQGDETETETKGDEGDDAETKPEGYEFALPEGVELDEAGATAFNELGKELGITQEQVTGLVPFFTERMQQAAQSWSDDLKATAEAQLQTQRDETLAFAPKGSEHARNAARVIEQFGDEETIKGLNESTVGDQLWMMKLCARVGAAIAEDTLEHGKGGGKQPAEHVEERGIYAT